MLNRGAMKNGADPGAGGMGMSQYTGCEDYFLKILEILEELPDVRQEKVAKLKKQIEASSYRVDADRIAERMLEEALMDTLHLSRKNCH
jgi:hypothetical protein